MEERKEVLLREASESGLIDSTLQEKLAELDSEKPRPYGTLHAVGSSFPFYSFLVFGCKMTYLFEFMVAFALIAL
jgi:hypothetical protein